MKKEIKANNTFEKIVVTRDQAMKDSESGRLGGLTERPGNPSKFKLGNLEAIPEGEPISYFKNGDFVDLCAGPHVMRTGNVGAFKLTQCRQRLLQSAMSAIPRSSSAFTALPSKTRPRWTLTSP